MSIVLCLLIFIFINVKGWKYITSPKTFEIRSPWNKQERVSFSGPEMFLLLTMGCAMIAAAPGFLAIRLLLWIFLLLIGLSKGNRGYFCKTSFLYVLYLFNIVVSLCWSQVPVFGGRVFLKYFLPFLLLIYVPTIIKNKECFTSVIQWISISLMAFFVTNALGKAGLGFLLAPIQGMWWWPPAIVDSFSVFLPLCLIGYVLFSERKYIILICAMAILPLIGYVNRTGLVAMFISSVAMSVFHYKMRAVPYLLTIVVVAFLAVVYIPQLRSKMFYEQYATEEYAKDYANWNWEMVNSNGRFAMWDDLLENHFRNSPWLGSGAGTEQADMYQTKRFGRLRVCHCDYVQILCDNGLVGIILYGMSLAVLIAHSFFLYNDKKRHLYCRYSAFIAGTGMCGMAAAMMTDNVVNYTMCTLVFPFIFYGMALGLQKFKPSQGSEKCSA